VHLSYDVRAGITTSGINGKIVDPTGNLLLVQLFLPYMFPQGLSTELLPMVKAFSLSRYASGRPYNIEVSFIGYLKDN